MRTPPRNSGMLLRCCASNDSTRIPSGLSRRPVAGRDATGGGVAGGLLGAPQGAGGGRFREADGSGSASPSSTRICTERPSRISSTSAIVPGLNWPISGGRSRESFKGRPLMRNTTSPARRPDSAAGESGVTSRIRAPRTVSRPSAVAEGASRPSTTNPSQARRTRPSSRNCSATRSARSMGIANPTPVPAAPRGSVSICVLTPTTRPKASNRGPPECPGWMAASVCR